MILNEMKSFLHGQRDTWEENDTSSYSGLFCVPVCNSTGRHDYTQLAVFAFPNVRTLFAIPGLWEARKGG
jgi:hypothetical protein